MAVPMAGAVSLPWGRRGSDLLRVAIDPGSIAVGLVSPAVLVCPGSFGALERPKDQHLLVAVSSARRSLGRRRERRAVHGRFVCPVRVAFHLSICGAIRLGIGDCSVVGQASGFDNAHG